MTPGVQCPPSLLLTGATFCVRGGFAQPQHMHIDGPLLVNMGPNQMQLQAISVCHCVCVCVCVYACARCIVWVKACFCVWLCVYLHMPHYGIWWLVHPIRSEHRDDSNLSFLGPCQCTAQYPWASSCCQIGNGATAAFNGYSSYP